MYWVPGTLSVQEVCSRHIYYAEHGRHQHKALQAAYGIQIAYDKEEGRKGNKTEKMHGSELLPIPWHQDMHMDMLRGLLHVKLRGGCVRQHGGHGEDRVV